MSEKITILIADDNAEFAKTFVISFGYFGKNNNII